MQLVTQYFCRFLLISLAFFPLVNAHAQVTGLAVEVTASGSELLTFSTKSPVEPRKSFTLSKPDRIVVDLPRVSANGVGLPKNYKGSVLKAVRFGQFDANTSRLVLDLKAKATLVSAKGGAPFTIEIMPANCPDPKAKANQLPLIVIDAGHGGQDPGALGLHGTHEKDVTLNYARALRTALIETGRYRAELTRDDDQFIMLPERVAIARKKKADLFVSIHADTNPKADARGLSIYTLSETASDAEAEALAERENKVDIVPGIDLNTADPDVASILIDLTQRETMNKSALLADAVVTSLHGRITKLPRTHRFAGFRVLKGPDIPSVLIELGFLSNVTDERLLLTAEYRDAVIASIIKGIDRYRAGE